MKYQINATVTFDDIEEVWQCNTCSANFEHYLDCLQHDCERKTVLSDTDVHTKMTCTKMPVRASIVRNPYMPTEPKERWQPGTLKIDGRMIAHIRYCPWCGKEVVGI